MNPTPRLARVLTAKGAIQDPAWHRAVLAVPRHRFVPDTVWADSTEHPGQYSPYPRDADPEVQRWMGEDVCLITQVDDGHPAGEDGRGLVPTSSLSQPSLVLAMLEALDTDSGHRVLEVGTGSGYNTALLCERLGSERVTSVEVDKDVAEEAGRVLGELGYAPELVVGDGAEPPPGVYDRILSTVAVDAVPPAWITATRVGGVIVTPWSPGPGFSSSVLLRLEVADDGTAEGRIVGDAAFMLLRDQRVPPRGVWSYVDEDAANVVATVTMTSPRWPSDRRPGWVTVLGHLVPGLSYASFEAKEDAGEEVAGEATVYVFDRNGSWALGEYTPDGAPYEARRAGPRDLWDEIGAARHTWEQAGRPGRDRLGLTVTAEGEHLLWVDTPDRVFDG